MHVTTSLPEYVLGVDGGGTKTAAWLSAIQDAQVLGRGQGGPGNPRAVGFDAAFAGVEEAIAAAFHNAGLPRQTVAAACFALAGAGRAVEQERIQHWALEQGVAQQCHVCGDAEPILAAATDEDWGIALISGTGSLAWGRGMDGRVARTGGWGYLIGDEGSGYRVALAALRAAMHAADGRGPRTTLLDRFQEHFGIDDASGLIGQIYDESMTRERLSALAILVFREASRDDVAHAVIARAADELAIMVATLASQLDLPPGEYPLAVSGSMLLNQPSLRELLRQRLHDRRQAPDEILLVPEPVQGAVKLARRLLADGAPVA